MWPFHRKRRSTRMGWEPTRAQKPPLPQAGLLGGRRYLVEHPYALPKDQAEQDRLDFQHYGLRSLLGGDYIAPLPATVHRILDVGTGTGKWAYELCHHYPNAEVMGVDLEAPLTPAREQPINYTFVRADLLQGLPFPAGLFDFVHMRLLGVAIPARCWPTVVQELVRVTRPGGFVELLEISDVYTHAGPATRRIMDWWHRVEQIGGFQLSLLAHLGVFLHHAGAREIQTHTLEVPLGKWGGYGGELIAKDLEATFRSLKSFYCTHLAIAPEHYDATVEGLLQEWEEYHTTYHFYTAYGKR